MQVTETTSEGLKRGYKIVIAASDLDEKIEGRLEELSGRINVPGFRPGKVPMAILKQRFGASVRGEVIESAVNDGSQQVIDERGIRPATIEPNVLCKLLISTMVVIDTLFYKCFFDLMQIQLR